jgi:hypothetical protein
MSTNFTAPGANASGWGAKIRPISRFSANAPAGARHSRVTAIRPIPVGPPTTPGRRPVTSTHAPTVDDDPDDFGGHAA